MTLDDLLSRLEGVHRSGNKATALCPAHEDNNSSLSATEGRDGRILLKCHAGCTFEQIVAALRLQMSDLMGGNGHKRTRHVAPSPSKTWTICGAQGRVIAEHHRIDLPGGKKRIWWTRDSMKGLGRLLTSDLPLYGSELVKDIPIGAEIIYVTEGEKAADAMREKGVLALGTVTGAKGTPGLESLSVLRGRDAILWPDFDDVGRAHMDRIGRALAGVAARVRFLSWGEQKGDDVADYFARGGTLEGLPSLVEKKPSAEGVTPAELLDAIAAFIRRFVVLSQAQADVIALWVPHTHAIEVADSTPYLAITSAEMESGKTRLLEVLELLVRRPWRAITPSEAVLYRKVSAEEPTLLLDEIDAIFGPNAKEHEGLRALLNAGNRRGAIVPRCVNKGDQLVNFSVFCPRALAGIGKLPRTIASRSLPIRLKRRLRSEQVERFRFRDVEQEAAALRQRLEAWTLSAVELLRRAERPPVPDALKDREQDGAEPLLAIADLAGGIWSERARGALVELCRGEEADDESLGLRLLGDIRHVFDERGVDRLSSEELVKALRADDEAPWDDLRGRPLNPRTLGRLLGPYGVKPRVIRLDDGHTPRGYLRDSFEDAWERYLPSPPASEAQHAQQINSGAGFLPFSDPQQPLYVADAKSHESPTKTGIVAHVADKEPGGEEKGEGGAEEATPQEAQEPDNAGREALL